MKNFKAISLIIAFVMALSLFSFSAFAEDSSTPGTSTPTVTDPEEQPTEPQEPTDPTEPVDPDAPVESGDWTYKRLTDTTIELIAYKGTAAQCQIPDKLDNKEVTSLASAVVRNNAEIIEVIIPGTITSLPADSFMGCINLKKITVKSGKLQKFDVEFCQSLEAVNLPATIKSIGIFEHCPMLKEINIEAKNASLKSSAGVVYSADGKTLVKYPAGKLSSRFVIPSTITTVADYAFSETRSNIKEIFVPGTVLKMGNNAFYDSVAKILFQAAKIPAGCENAVKGKQTAINQINVYAPKKVSSKENASAIKLEWEKVTGADGYRVYYKTAKGWKALANITANTITFKNLKAGARYTFAVRSLVRTAGGVVASPNYITYETATYPVATSKIANAKSDVAIKIAWAKVAGADGYAIYNKTSKGWNHLANTTGTTATFKKLNPYTSYTFAVRTLIKTDNKLIAGQYRTVTVKTNIGVPTVTAQQSGTNAIKFTWTRSIGASHYQVFYKVNNSDWALLGTYSKIMMPTIPNLNKGLNVSLAVRGVRVEKSKVVAKSAYVPVTVTIK